MKSSFLKMILFVMIFAVSFSCVARSQDEAEGQKPLVYRAQLKEINKQYEEGSLTKTEYIQRKRDLDARYSD